MSSDPPIRASDEPVWGGTGETKSLHCEVCAVPDPTSYRWTYNGEDLREGIDGDDTDTITINGVLNEDFGNYSCEVANAFGDTQFDIELLPYRMYDGIF